MIIADSGYITEYDYPVTVQCIVRESIKQDLEPEMVWAILRQENGRVNKHSINKNKTLDIGPMQINNGKMEKALHDLQAETNMNYSEFKERLYSDACFNVSVGAYVLKKKINASGSKFKGMGWYNSANEPHYSRYLASVKEHYYNLKNSAKAQQEISAAKLDLYASEYKVHPQISEFKKSNAKVKNSNNIYQDNNRFYSLPSTIRIPKNQIVYR